MIALSNSPIKEYSHSNVTWGEAIEFVSTRNIKQYTHRLYNRYPARSVSLVPRAILSDLHSPSCGGQLRVLDPFMGSGTTAVEATLRGMLPYGVEIDPFARLVSEVKVQAYNNDELSELSQLSLQISKNWRDYSPDESFKPQAENIDYWFEEGTFQELLQLKNAIHDISGDNRRVLNFFRLVFADIIRPCSKAERQTLKPYISKKYPKQPAGVADTWTKSFSAYFEAVEEYSKAMKARNWGIIWLGRDATNFSSEENFIDTAISSPPYINALDYVRCIKIESAWVDCGNDDIFAELRKGHVGEAVRVSSLEHSVVREIEPYLIQLKELDRARAEVVQGYFHDMFANLSLVHRALKPGAQYHIIVGNSIIRGIYIPTHEIIAKLAQHIGFAWCSYYSYKIKDHRTSIPRNGNGGKIDVEHVVSLQKRNI